MKYHMNRFKSPQGQLETLFLVILGIMVIISAITLWRMWSGYHVLFIGLPGGQ